MNSFFILPFWQEFGLILGGTLLLFFALIRLEKAIRKKGDSDGKPDKTDAR